MDPWSPRARLTGPRQARPNRGGPGPVDPVPPVFCCGPLVPMLVPCPTMPSPAGPYQALPSQISASTLMSCPVIPSFRISVIVKYTSWEQSSPGLSRRRQIPSRHSPACSASRRTQASSRSGVHSTPIDLSADGFKLHRPGGSRYKKPSAPSGLQIPIAERCVMDSPKLHPLRLGDLPPEH